MSAGPASGAPEESQPVVPPTQPGPARHGVPPSRSGQAHGSAMMRWLGVVSILILTGALMSTMSLTGSAEPMPPRGPVEEVPALLAAPAASGSRGFVPKKVRVSTIGVDAPVLAMGTDDEGAMELPEDPKVLGWWRGSSRAGAAAGNTVIAGHVYERDHGYGALWSLPTVQPGDRIDVLGTKDRRKRFVVTKVTKTRKVDLDPATIFKAEGAHQLVLVTCGTYNRVTDHYEDNVIVYAVPA